MVGNLVQAQDQGAALTHEVEKLLKNPVEEEVEKLEMVVKCQ